jgi:hypothetical protein
MVSESKNHAWSMVSERAVIVFPSNDRGFLKAAGQSMQDNRQGDWSLLIGLNDARMGLMGNGRCVT